MHNTVTYDGRRYVIVCRASNGALLVRNVATGKERHLYETARGLSDRPELCQGRGYCPRDPSCSE